MTPGEIMALAKSVTEGLSERQADALIESFERQWFSDAHKRLDRIEAELYDIRRGLGVSVPRQEAK